MPQTEMNHIKTPNFGVNLHSFLSNTDAENWSIGCHPESQIIKGVKTQKINNLSKSLEIPKT